MSVAASVVSVRPTVATTAVAARYTAPGAGTPNAAYPFVTDPRPLYRSLEPRHALCSSRCLSVPGPIKSDKKINSLKT